MGIGKNNCFMTAAIYGHVNIIKYFIEYLKYPIETTGANRYTALHHAAENGYESLLGYLIISGANINSRDKYKRTPLMLAVKCGQYRIVSILLKLKAKKKHRRFLK